MTSSCRRCGRCCRAISLDQTKAELRVLANREAQRLVRNPHHPHRAQIERLLADVGFIERHFHDVRRSKAAKANPALAGIEFDGRAFYTCDQLTASGRCLSHKTRPYVCEGYPWYHSAASRALLTVLPCGYEAELTPQRLPVR